MDKETIPIDISEEQKESEKVMKNIGVAAFLVGVILIGLSLTWWPGSNQLLFGLIIGAAGVALMYLGRSE
jgi:uncharacterized membrane protein